MTRKKKKLRAKLARQVIDGKIGAAEARARMSAQAPGKAREEQAYQGLAAAAAALKSAAPVTQQDMIDAVRIPLPRPVITTAAPAGPGLSPQEALKMMRSVTEKRAPLPPARPWTAAQRVLLAEIEASSDPVMREAYRAALYKQRGGT